MKSNANTQIEKNFSFKENSLSIDTFYFLSSSTYFSLYPNLFNNCNSQDNFSYLLEFHPNAQNFYGFPDDKLCFRDEEKKHYSYESLGKYKVESHILLERLLLSHYLSQ